MPLGTLFTVSAPSGAGKTSLVKALIESDERLCVSVSHTTRAIRKGETDGVNYHFVDEAVFEQMANAGAFLEYATVFGNAYGTSKEWVQSQLEKGTDVILEIDWQGAGQIQKALGAENVTAIFILPPSLAALQQRLQGRGQDDASVIERRMSEAVNEISHYGEADFLIVNDDFEDALHSLQAVVESQRLRLAPQRERLRALLVELSAIV